MLLYKEPCATRKKAGNLVFFPFFILGAWFIEGSNQNKLKFSFPSHILPAKLWGGPIPPIGRSCIFWKTVMDYRLILEYLWGLIFLTAQDRIWSILGRLLQIQTKIDLVPQLGKLQRLPWIVLSLLQTK